MLKCKDISAMSSDYVDNKLSFRGKLNFYLHLAMCVHCRRYIRQFKMMLSGSKHLNNEPLEDDEVDRILAHVKKQQDKDS